MRKSSLIAIVLSSIFGLVGCASTSIDEEARNIKAKNLEEYARKIERELGREVLLPEDIPQSISSYYILKTHNPAQNLISVKLVKSWDKGFIIVRVDYSDKNKDGKYEKKKMDCFYGNTIPHIREISTHPR